MDNPKRLRTQAELQSLFNRLANLREREADYFQTVTGVPNLMANEITKVRREIARLESELSALNEGAIETPADRFYREAYAAELAGDLTGAEQLYKQAARHDHLDADAAGRSVRQRRKGKKAAISDSVKRSVVGFAVLIPVVAAILLWANYTGDRSGPGQQDTDVGVPTPIYTPPVVVLRASTSTPTFDSTTTPEQTTIPEPTITSQPAPAVMLPTDTPALPPSPPPTLQPPPKMIGPENNLVWQGGAIVFYFEKLDLAEDELYCLDTLRGYDRTLTENWSKEPTGSKLPSIAIEANAFEVAQTRGMQCVTWSAYIGRGSCANIVSDRTEPRVIGLPDPCNF